MVQSNFFVFSIRLGTKPVAVAPAESGGGANGNRPDPTWEVQVDSSRLSQVDFQIWSKPRPLLHFLNKCTVNFVSRMVPKFLNDA